MKFILGLFVLFASVQAFAFDSADFAGSKLGQVKQLSCGVNMVCSQSAGTLTVSQGGLVTLAANTTLTKAHCGKTITNSAAAIATLPEASTVLGCEITFIVGNVSNFGINPADASDTLLLLTNAAGDSIIADAIGESVTIVALSANAWAPKGAVQGAWTDSN